MRTFKVEIRTTCKVCGGPLSKRFRTYCSKKCRQKATNKRWYPKHKADATKKRGEYRPDKLQCLLCGKWYVQVVSHTRQAHKMFAEEYKEYFDLPISRGVIPTWYRELKGKIALENGTFKNLEAGKDQRYKKGDPKAKAVTGWKGRTGSKGYTDY